MSSETAVKIAALARWLRCLDPLAWTEIVPSPDFARLAVICDQDDPAQAGLYVGTVEDEALWLLVTFQDMGRLTQSVAGTVITRPCWSADGKWLAFVTYEGLPPGKAYRLWVVQAQVGLQPTLLYKGAGVIAAHLWAPDDSCLAVADSDAGLVIVHSDGTVKVIDAQAMRYPLGQNAMTWLNGGRQVVYVNLAPDQAGLWIAQIPDGQKRQVIALKQDELVIPAGLPHQPAWGALRGSMYYPESGVTLYFWPDGADEPETLLLSNLTFDPASYLLPNEDGSLWAFTVWEGGRRTPLVVDYTTRQWHALPLVGAVTRPIGWSDAPRTLWVLLHPPQLAGLNVDRIADPVLPVQDTLALELTSAELLYLLETMGAHRMFGLESSFLGMPKDESGRLREDAKRSLISKGYVAEVPGDRLRIDLTVATLVQCCVSPQQTWTVTFEGAAGESDVRHIHQVQTLIVEDAVLASGAHRLTPLRDHAAVLRRIEQQIRVGEQPAASGQPFVLREELLFRAREIVITLGGETAARYLIRMGVPEVTAVQFARALAHSVSNSSISRWNIGERTVVAEKGIGILEEVSGLWLLQPFVAEGLVWIRVSPANAATVREQIAALLAGKGTSSV